jgi:hypothetical protein
MEMLHLLQSRREMFRHCHPVVESWKLDMQFFFLHHLSEGSGPEHTIITVLAESTDMDSNK